MKSILSGGYEGKEGGTKKMVKRRGSREKRRRAEGLIQIWAEFLLGNNQVTKQAVPHTDHLPTHTDHVTDHIPTTLQTTLPTTYRPQTDRVADHKPTSVHNYRRLVRGFTWLPFVTDVGDEVVLCVGICRLDGWIRRQKLRHVHTPDEQADRHEI